MVDKVRKSPTSSLTGMLLMPAAASFQLVLTLHLLKENTERITAHSKFVFRTLKLAFSSFVSCKRWMKTNKKRQYLFKVDNAQSEQKGSYIRSLSYLIHHGDFLLFVLKMQNPGNIISRIRIFLFKVLKKLSTKLIRWPCCANRRLLSLNDSRNSDSIINW